jgi:hypothetical protein
LTLIVFPLAPPEFTTPKNEALILYQLRGASHHGGGEGADPGHHVLHRCAVEPA